MPSPPVAPAAKMGTSLSSDPPTSAGSRNRDGRTPPPAPSAAWGQRAWEVKEVTHAAAEVPVAEAEEGMEEGNAQAGGYRRARAG